MRISQLKLNPFLLVLFIYLVAYLFVFPFGEFVVNDDWIFVRQIEAFLQGAFKINALVDPTFIAQGVSGFLWSKVFGLSFFSLRMLTLVFTSFFLN